MSNVDTETRETSDTETTAHPFACGCRDCDPDFYFDPAEADAGRPGERW